MDSRSGHTGCLPAWSAQVEQHSCGGVSRLSCCYAVLGEGAVAFRTQQLLLRNKLVRTVTALCPQYSWAAATAVQRCFAVCKPGLTLLHRVGSTSNGVRCTVDAPMQALLLRMACVVLSWAPVTPLGTLCIACALPHSCGAFSVFHAMRQLSCTHPFQLTAYLPSGVLVLLAAVPGCVGAHWQQAVEAVCHNKIV